MARGLRPLSTDPVADLEILFRRALFAWFIADGDMHLKNLALLKIAEPGARQFAKVYPAHARTRKSFGLMTRKLSVTESQKLSQFLGTFSRRNVSAASANSRYVA